MFVMPVQDRFSRAVLTFEQPPPVIRANLIHQPSTTTETDPMASKAAITTPRPDGPVIHWLLHSRRHNEFSTAWTPALCGPRAPVFGAPVLSVAVHVAVHLGFTTTLGQVNAADDAKVHIGSIR
jgi:hypothetical protein